MPPRVAPPSPPELASVRLDRRRALAGVAAASFFWGMTGAAAKGRARDHGSATGPALTLLFCHIDSLSPISYAMPDGHAAGLKVEAIDCVLTSLGWRQNAIALPWQRAQMLANTDQCDGIATISTPERAEKILFCRTPLFDWVPGIWHRENDDRPRTARRVADLSDLRQGNYRGNGWAKSFFGENGVTWANDAQGAMRMLAAGRTDVILHDETLFGLVVRENGMRDKLRFTPLPDEPLPTYTIGIRRSHPDAQAIVDRIEGALRAQRAQVLALVDHYRQAPS